MSLSHSLSNALSGLTAASRMAEVVSSNLANALTDGYARREVALSARSVVGRGAGVSIDGILRSVDRGLLSDRRLADATLARDSGIAGALRRLEQVTGAPGSEDSLGSLMARLETALVTAQGDPASDQRLGDVLDRFGAVTAKLNADAAAIQSLRGEAERGIADGVARLNEALGRVETLNGAIVAATARGEDASALMDQRQAVVDDISAIVPVRSFDRPNGQIALTTKAGAILIDGKAATIGFQRSGIVTADMTYGAGLLSGLTLNGQPVSPADGFSRFDGGSLGAAFRLRDEILPEASDRLDRVAADLIARFEDPGTDPTLGAATPGLLTDAGGRLNPGDLTGLAGRIAVNSAVDPERGGALFRFRDGVGATVAGPVGEAAGLARWRTALTTTRPLAGGTVAASAAGHAADFQSMIGSRRLTAEDSESFAAARQSVLRQSELAMGVDSDNELQTLLRVEQAYAANARVMQTIDGLMQRLMEI